MIKSLKILNFQSHEKSKLDFSTGVNVIVGTSDSGKTAIIRALRWLIWNRPSGDAIRSNWGGGCTVIVDTEEDDIVVRGKDKTDTYQLSRSGGKSLVFKAFGTSVPQEIADLLKINEINLQGQLDAPFLLSSSPGEVAQHFNKVARLDKIDKATGNINSAIRELTADIKYKEVDEARLEEQVKQFDYLDKFEAEVEVLEEMEKRSVTLKNAQRKLADLIRKATDITEQVEECTDLPALEPIVDKLTGLFADARAKQQAVATLSRAINTLLALDQTLLKTQQNALKLEERFHTEMPDICPLCEQPINKK
jgi:exonuclease SbcC